MKRKNRFLLAGGLALFFLLFTAALSHIDVQIAGESRTPLGFATVNLCFHGMTGVNLPLYTLTDWLGIVPFCVCIGFAALGAVQSSF